jgi:flavin reductase (DIM6/NTAB) family NADH-FMN oxidoreductase RutF
MHFAPRAERCPLPYDPFKSCTVPRPIGWISSISRAGICNLAPFSQWQNITFDPPIVMFAANRHPDGRRKDTVVNAEETGFFCWNMATHDLREAVNLSAVDHPPHVDEFATSGVTKIPAIDGPAPRVAESPCHFECRTLSIQTFPGRSVMGTADVVFAEVIRIHVRDDVVTPEGKLDIPRIKPIARLGYYDYTTVTNTFEMIIPALDADVLVGLEGKRFAG